MLSLPTLNPGFNYPKASCCEGFQNIADVPVIPAQTRDRPMLWITVQKVSKGSGRVYFQPSILRTQQVARREKQQCPSPEKFACGDSGLKVILGLVFPLRSHEYITMIPRMIFSCNGPLSERVELLDYRFGLQGNLNIYQKTGLFQLASILTPFTPCKWQTHF